jgi:hypothetical protein
VASPGRVLPARRRILSGKLAVKGLPAAERRDAKAAGRSALYWQLSRDRIAQRGEGGPAALAGAATGVRDGEVCMAAGAG